MLLFLLRVFKLEFNKRQLLGMASCLTALMGTLSVYGAEADTTSFLKYMAERRSEAEYRLEQKITSTLLNFLKKDEISLSVKINLNTALMRQDLPRQIEETIVYEPQGNQASEPLLPLTKLGLYKRPQSVQRVTRLNVRPFEDYVSSVQILFIVDEEVSEDVNQKAQTLIQQIVTSSSLPEPSLQSQTIALKRPPEPTKEELAKKEEEKNEGQKDLASEEKATAKIPEKTVMDWLVEFKIPIGIILSTFVLFLLGLVVSSRYQKFESQRIAIMQAKSEREEADARARYIENEDRATKEEDFTALSDDELARGFNEFKKLIQSRPGDAAILIKGWLASSHKEPQYAVAVLPEFLGSEFMEPIVSRLDRDERRRWAEATEINTGARERQVASLYISKQIVQLRIKPEEGLSDDLVELISGLSPQECCDAIRQNEIVGALILNVLPTLQVAQILNLLTPKEVERVTSISVEFDKEALASRQKEIKQTIDQVVGSHRQESSPFVERIPQLLREAGPEKENFLYQRLIESVPKAKAFEIVMDIYPMNLLFELPNEILNFSLEKWPLSKRAELIYGLEDLQKDKILSGFSGSKIRDIIDAEIEQIELSDSRKRTVLAEKDLNLRSFLNMTREVVKNNTSFRTEAERLADNWLEQFYRGRSQNDQVA